MNLVTALEPFVDGGIWAQSAVVFDFASCTTSKAGSTSTTPSEFVIQSYPTGADLKASLEFLPFATFSAKQPHCI